MADLDEVYDLATDLITEHPTLADWSFKFDDAKQRFGQCRHGDKTITLSRSLAELNSLDVVTNTILHEIAHALCGPAHGHDSAWKNQARALGCSAERCYDTKEVAGEEGPWLATCPLCGSQHRKWRQPKMGRSAACRDCCETLNNGKFMAAAEFVWQYRP